MKASLQLVAHGGQVLGVVAAMHVRRGHVDLHDPSVPDSPCLPITGVDEQPMEPGVEAVGVSNGADVQPGGDERLLDGVGRHLVASQDQSRGPVQPVERVRRERREGVVVAVCWRAGRGLAASDFRLGGGTVAALTHHESGGKRLVPSLIPATATAVPDERWNDCASGLIPGDSAGHADTPRKGPEPSCRVLQSAAPRGRHGGLTPCSARFKMVLCLGSRSHCSQQPAVQRRSLRRRRWPRRLESPSSATVDSRRMQQCLVAPSVTFAGTCPAGRTLAVAGTDSRSRRPRGPSAVGSRSSSAGHATSTSAVEIHGLRVISVDDTFSRPK